MRGNRQMYICVDVVRMQCMDSGDVEKMLHKGLLYCMGKMWGTMEENLELCKSLSIITGKLITTKVGCRAALLLSHIFKEPYISGADKAVSIALRRENTTNVHFVCKKKCLEKKLEGWRGGSHWALTLSLSFSDSLQIYKYSSPKWIHSFFNISWISIQMDKFILAWRSSVNLKCLWSSLSWLKRKGLGAFCFLPCPLLAIGKRHFSEVAVHLPSLLLNFGAFCLL